MTRYDQSLYLIWVYDLVILTCSTQSIEHVPIHKEWSCHLCDVFEWLGKKKVKDYTCTRWLYEMETEWLLNPSRLSFSLIREETVRERKIQWQKSHSTTGYIPSLFSFFLVLSQGSNKYKGSYGTREKHKIRSISRLSFVPEGGWMLSQQLQDTNGRWLKLRNSEWLECT